MHYGLYERSAFKQNGHAAPTVMYHSTPLHGHYLEVYTFSTACSNCLSAEGIYKILVNSLAVRNGEIDY